jgi:hypothetical protein
LPKKLSFIEKGKMGIGLEKYLDPKPLGGFGVTKLDTPKIEESEVGNFGGLTLPVGSAGKLGIGNPGEGLVGAQSPCFGFSEVNKSQQYYLSFTDSQKKVGSTDILPTKDPNLNPRGVFDEDFEIKIQENHTLPKETLFPSTLLRLPQKKPSTKNCKRLSISGSILTTKRLSITSSRRDSSKFSETLKESTLNDTYNNIAIINLLEDYEQFPSAQRYFQFFNLKEMKSIIKVVLREAKKLESLLYRARNFLADARSSAWNFKRVKDRSKDYGSQEEVTFMDPEGKSKFIDELKRGSVHKSFIDKKLVGRLSRFLDLDQVVSPLLRSRRTMGQSVTGSPSPEFTRDSGGRVGVRSRRGVSPGFSKRSSRRKITPMTPVAVEDTGRGRLQSRRSGLENLRNVSPSYSNSKFTPLALGSGKKMININENSEFTIESSKDCLLPLASGKNQKKPGIGQKRGSS